MASSDESDEESLGGSAWDDDGPHSAASYGGDYPSPPTSGPTAAALIGDRSPCVLRPYTAAGAPPPLFAPPPPPSPPQQRTRVSPLATFASENLVYLWFAPPASHGAEALGGDGRRERTGTAQASKHQLVPSEAFMRFCHNVLATTQVSYSVVILALLFVYRLKSRNNIQGAPGSEFRLFICSAMMANKILDDNTYTAATWAQVSGLKLEPLVAGEAEFLQGLDWQLHVTERDFAGWIKLLEQHIALRKAQLTPPRRLFGVRRGGACAPRVVSKGPLLFGLGLGAGSPFETEQDVPIIGRRRSDDSRPPPHSIPTPTFSSFASFPSTPTSNPPSYSFPRQSHPSNPPSFSPPSNSFAPPPRYPPPRSAHSHSRSADVYPPPAPASTPPRPKRAAETAFTDEAGLQESMAKRLNAAGLSRSFSAGAEPPPSRSVFVFPRGTFPAYVHQSHRIDEEQGNQQQQTRYLPPPAPSSFQHLAGAFKFPPTSRDTPESLDFYSLAAGQRQGVARRTSTDPNFRYQYTPTPRPLSSFSPTDGYYEASGSTSRHTPQDYTSSTPPSYPSNSTFHHRPRHSSMKDVYSNYANAGPAGVCWGVEDA